MDKLKYRLFLALFGLIALALLLLSVSHLTASGEAEIAVWAGGGVVALAIMGLFTLLRALSRDVGPGPKK